MGLVNVRLNSDLERKIRELRADGVVVSDLLRQAIEQAYAAKHAKRTKSHLAVLREIEASYPPTADDLPRRYNLADRKQMRAAMLERLQPKARRKR